MRPTSRRPRHGLSLLWLLPVLCLVAIWLSWQAVQAKLARAAVGKPSLVAATAFGRVEAVHVKPGDRIEPGRELVSFVVTDAAGGTGVKKEVSATREVTVVRLAGERFEDTVELPGLASPVIECQVSAQVGGRILERPVDAGGAVKKGDLICRIEKRDFEIGVERAEAALALARISFDRIDSLVRGNAGSKADRDRAESEYKGAVAARDAAALALARTEIYAPLDGLVDRTFVEVGELIDPGKPVAKLIDISRIKVTIGIPEQDVAAVRDATELSFVVPSLANREFKGKVDHLGVSTAPEARIFPLELRLDNPGGALLPGMIVKARVVRAIYDRAILLPLFSIIPGDDAYYTYVHENGRAVRRTVRLGAFRERRVQILEGLALGDEVIEKGLRLVSDGTPVRVVR